MVPGGGVPLVPAKPKNHETLSLSVAVNLDEKQKGKKRTPLTRQRQNPRRGPPWTQARSQTQRSSRRLQASEVRGEYSSCSHYYRRSRPRPPPPCRFTSPRGFGFICTSDGKSPQVAKPHVDPFLSPRTGCLCGILLEMENGGAPSRGQFWTDPKISATWFTRDRKSVPTHPFSATTGPFQMSFYGFDHVQPDD